MVDQERHHGLSADEVFEILSNARRRYMIHYLHQEDGSATLSDIADHIAAWEYDTAVDRIDNDQRRRVYISLYQTHLPKLVEYGVVDYDDETKTVRLTGRVAALDRFLYTEPDAESRWWIPYVVLSFAAAVLLVASWLDGPPLAPLSGELLALLIAAAFILLSAVHYAAVRTGRRHRWVGRDW